MTKEQTLSVKADPRDPAVSGYQHRHDFLVGLFDELGGINTMLNTIDSRLKSASGAKASALLALKHELTYDPRNVEDLNGPAELRERLLDLISRMGTSFQAPTASQFAQAAVYKTEYDRIFAAYRAL